MEYILRTRKLSYVKIHFHNIFEIFGIFQPITVFETTAIIKTSKFTVLSSGSFCKIYRVTDEALIAKTMVWPNFFLINVFFALKGSKFFIIISRTYAHDTNSTASCDVKCDSLSLCVCAHQ